MNFELPKQDIAITDEELKSLTDAIHQRHGIDFGCYEPKSLKRRVIRTLHIFKLDSVHTLWLKLLREHSFIFPFMDEISVGLTAMFRDPVLWRRMRSLLNNELSSKKSLSVWHAGCSTGEEVYTMGIVMKESEYMQPVRAWATDISNAAMTVARTGEYHVMKMEEYGRNYTQFNPRRTLKDYYTLDHDHARMDPDLIKHVTFEHHNLITGSFNRTYDLIFCRNVMIYFDNEAKRKLFEKFYSALNPGGFFVIGFYDAVLPLIDPAKFDVYDMDAKIFQKI